MRPGCHCTVYCKSHLLQVLAEGPMTYNVQITSVRWLEVVPYIHDHGTPSACPASLMAQGAPAHYGALPWAA